MTVQIIITIIVLIIFLILQGNFFQKRCSNTLKSTLYNGIILILLPISYHNIAVISNLVFEAVNDNLNWFTMICIPIWLINLIYLFRIIKLRKIKILELFWMILMLLTLVFWYVFAITESHYESGPTPKITDSIYILIYFLSVHLIIISTLILQFLTWKKFLKFEKITTIVLLTFYVMILLNNFIDFL